MGRFGSQGVATVLVGELLWLGWGIRNGSGGGARTRTAELAGALGLGEGGAERQGREVDAGAAVEEAEVGEKGH